MTAPAPGPYEWIESSTTTANGQFHAYVVDKNGRKIAAVWGRGDEKAATASLLSAAYELAEALKDAYRHLNALKKHPAYGASQTTLDRYAEVLRKAGVP